MRLDSSKWNPKGSPAIGAIVTFFGFGLMAAVTDLALIAVLGLLSFFVVALTPHRRQQIRNYCAWVDIGQDRAEKLREVAESLELQFDAGPNARLLEKLEPKFDLILGRRFSCYEQYAERYARIRNIISGEYQQARFTYFEIFYITQVVRSIGGDPEEAGLYKNITPAVVIELPGTLPGLRIAPETRGDGNARSLSEDIDLDSYEFSELFDIRSEDKKFAYDVCNPKMMELLIERKSMSIRIHENLMLLPFSQRQAFDDPAGTIDTFWSDLKNIRSRMPNFLFDTDRKMRDFVEHAEQVDPRDSLMKKYDITAIDGDYEYLGTLYTTLDYALAAAKKDRGDR